MPDIFAQSALTVLGVLSGVPLSLALQLGPSDLFYAPARLVRHLYNELFWKFVLIFIVRSLLSLVLVLLLFLLGCRGAWNSYIAAFSMGIFSALLLSSAGISCIFPKLYSNLLSSDVTGYTDSFIRQTLKLFILYNDDFIRVSKQFVSHCRRDAQEDALRSWNMASIEKRMLLLQEFDYNINSVRLPPEAERARRECLKMYKPDELGVDPGLEEYLEGFFVCIFQQSSGLAACLLKRL